MVLLVSLEKPKGKPMVTWSFPLFGFPIGFPPKTHQIEINPLGVNKFGLSLLKSRIWLSLFVELQARDSKGKSDPPQQPSGHQRGACRTPALAARQGLVLAGGGGREALAGRLGRKSPWGLATFGRCCFPDLFFYSPSLVLEGIYRNHCSTYFS